MESANWWPVQLQLGSLFSLSLSICYMPRPFFSLSNFFFFFFNYLKLYFMISILTMSRGEMHLGCTLRAYMANPYTELTCTTWSLIMYIPYTTIQLCLPMAFIFMARKCLAWDRFLGELRLFYRKCSMEGSFLGPTYSTRMRTVYTGTC